jgi:hypothetical protein
MEAVKSLVQLLFALSLTTTVDACITKLSHADRIALEQQPTIKMLFSTGELPAAVISACATVTADHQFWLAKPGDRFQASDVVGGLGSLPRRRLIWIARLADYFVVHYEYGGIGLGYHVLVVHSDSRFHSANVVWSAVGPRLASYNDFIKAIGQNKLDDTLPYYY